MSKACKIIPVKNRLGQLMRRPGGISRSEAVEAAGKAVETLRDEYVEAIPGEIAALEAIAAERGSDRIATDDIEAMIDRAGRLLTLSGTFGYDLLDQVVKRFCDLAAGMIEYGIDDLAPIDVHLRAMRLVCPSAPALSQAEVDEMMNGLWKVHAHYGIRSREPAAPSEEIV